MKAAHLSSALLLSALLVSACKKPKPPEAVTATPSASSTTTTPVAKPDEKPEPEIKAPPEPPKPDRKVLLNQINDAVALLTLGSTEASKRALVILKSAAGLFAVEKRFLASG